MRSVLIGLVVIGLAAGSALAGGSITFREFGTNATNLAFNNDVSHEINVEVWITPGSGTANRMVITQGVIESSVPGPTWKTLDIAATSGEVVPMYTAGSYFQDTTNSKWDGWVAPDPGDPTAPLVLDPDNTDTLSPLPGGPLPTPFLLSSRVVSNNNLAHSFAVVTIIIPAGQPAGGIDIGGSLSSSKWWFFSGSGGDITPAALNPLHITMTPEPISALLMLAGLPLLRRRR